MASDKNVHDKPCLVLLAGLLCDHSVWTGVAARLEDIAHIDIIHFDGFATLEAMAEHIIATAPPRFVLIGHSMGGRVALEVVRRTPQRVRALGLFNTGVHAVGEHEPASRQELVRIAQEAGMRELARRWLPPMMDSNSGTSEALYARLTAMVERTSPASFAKQISALLNRPNALAVLPTIHVPTLLLSATGDRWSPVAQHEEIRRYIPHADLVVIQNAGHMAPVERPDAVVAAIRDWLATLGDEQLNDLQRLSIETQCTQRIHRYARLNDANQFDALADLYTEDGVFARPSEPDIHLRGRSAILASLKARPPRPTRHLMTGIEVTVDSSTRARAHSNILLLIGEGATSPATIKATLLGTFDDVLQKVNGEWLFTQRLGALQMKA